MGYLKYMTLADSITQAEIQLAQRSLMHLDQELKEKRTSLQKLAGKWLYLNEIIEDAEADHFQIIRYNDVVKNNHLNLLEEAYILGKALVSRVKKHSDYDHESLDHLISEINDKLDHLNFSIKGWKFPEAKRKIILSKVFGVKESKT
jgi:hypothetical protein